MLLWIDPVDVVNKGDLVLIVQKVDIFITETVDGLVSIQRLDGELSRCRVDFCKRNRKVGWTMLHLSWISKARKKIKLNSNTISVHENTN